MPTSERRCLRTTGRSPSPVSLPAIVVSEWVLRERCRASERSYASATAGVVGADACGKICDIKEGELLSTVRSIATGSGELGLSGEMVPTDDEARASGFGSDVMMPPFSIISLVLVALLLVLPPPAPAPTSPSCRRCSSSSSTEDYLVKSKGCRHAVSF